MMMVPKRVPGILLSQSRATRSFSVRLDSETSLSRELELVEIPSLPFVGSLIPQHSGAPPYSLDKMYETSIARREKFGDFYSYGLPLLGVGVRGTLYHLTDPSEMVKVIRAQGSYPSGMTQLTWPLIHFHRDAKTPTTAPYDDGGWFGNGKSWRRFRLFLNKDLLAPDAAKKYVPAIVEAAQHASKGAGSLQKNMADYTGRCAFDMFAATFFGEMTRTATTATAHSTPVVLQENTEYCQSAVEGISMIADLNTRPMDMALHDWFGIKTGRYREYLGHMTKARNIALSKVEAFKDRRQRGLLNEFERSSYCAKAMERRDNLVAAAASERHDDYDDGDDEPLISESEMNELLVTALPAAIDTTAAVLNWNLIHLALNKNVQEKLHAELSTNLASNSTMGDGNKNDNNRLDEDMLSKSKSPYLHAVIRESHRLTPALTTGCIKQVEGAVEIHGRMMPRGSVFALDNYAFGMDPGIVSDPKEFRPERWLPEGVRARSGTLAKALDHPFYAEPFSQGPRKCPGTRVAKHEVFAMIAQLILDWRFSLAPHENIKGLDDISHWQGSVIGPNPMPQFQFLPRNRTQ